MSNDVTMDLDAFRAEVREKLRLGIATVKSDDGRRLSSLLRHQVERSLGDHSPARLRRAARMPTNPKPSKAKVPGIGTDTGSPK